MVLHYPLKDSYIEPTTNLVTSLKAGGRTSIVNNQVITNGENADTYFYLNLSTAIAVGNTYTISCEAEIPTEQGNWTFGIGSQSTGPKFQIYNGHNEFTFTADSGVSWSTSCIFDDTNRGNALVSKFYNF
mgnify:CR=1 FL=1